MSAADETFSSRGFVHTDDDIAGARLHIHAGLCRWVGGCLAHGAADGRVEGTVLISPFAPNGFAPAVQTSLQHFAYWVRCR